MPLAAPNVLLVAGRPAQWNEAWWLRSLLARLEDRSLEVPVFCVADGGMFAGRTSLIECPELRELLAQPAGLAARSGSGLS